MRDWRAGSTASQILTGKYHERSQTKKPASVWKSGLPTERDPSEHPSGSPTLGCPAPPIHRAPLGVVPPTGTEMEARPFGTDPETDTGAIPEPTLRGTEAGCPQLILAPPPFIYLNNHAKAEINEVIGTIAAPHPCPVSPHP